MSESSADPQAEVPAGAKPQSGVQVWIAAALFLVVPTLLILAVKYLFGI